MTTTAAKAVKTDSSTDLAGKLSGSKIPNATPVFRTYVMLKSPSMTEIDSLRSKRFWISALVQRSSASVTAAKTMYGKRLWNLNDMRSSTGLYQRPRGDWPARRTYGILDTQFPLRFGQIRL